MKILFYRYNSICEPDMIEAMKNLGHEVIEIREEMENKSFSLQECVALVGKHCWKIPMIWFLALTSILLFLRFVKYVKFGMLAGLWIVQCWNYTPMP